MALWPDVWVPIVDGQQMENFDFLTKRFSHGSMVLGRLRPGVTMAQATADLNAAAKEMARLYPHEDYGLTARLVKPGLFGDSIGAPARSFLTGVLVLALLVLTGGMHEPSKYLRRADSRARAGAGDPAGDWRGTLADCEGTAAGGAAGFTGRGRVGTVRGRRCCCAG